MVNNEIFKPLKIWKFLLGTSIYSFKEYYDAKSCLMLYDDRKDYCNLGFWKKNSQDDINPSAALVRETASRLELDSRDVLLDVGAGMGQPDLDIIKDDSPRDRVCPVLKPYFGSSRPLFICNAPLCLGIIPLSAGL